jgi:hypothetical protein
LTLDSGSERLHLFLECGSTLHYLFSNAIVERSKSLNPEFDPVENYNFLEIIDIDDFDDDRFSKQ